MARLSWKVTGLHAERGKGVTKTISAPTEAAAKAEAVKQGLVGVKVSKQGKLSQFWSSEHFSALPSKEIAEFARYLAFSADSGMSELDAISNFRATARKRTTAVVAADIEQDCRTGSTLAEALLAQSTRLRGTTLADVYEAGMKSGTVKEALEALAESMERAEEAKAAVKKALIYPAIQLTITVMVFAALMLIVVPEMTNTLKDVAGEDTKLPLPTRMMMGTSEVITTKWVMFILIAVLMWATARLLKTNEEIGTSWDALKLKMPVVGELIQSMVMASTCHLVGVFLTAQLPIHYAFNAAGNSSSNRRLRNAYKAVPRRLQMGMSPEDAVAAECPPLDLELRQLTKLSTSGIDSPGAPWITFAVSRSEKAQRRAHALTEAIQPAFVMLSGGMLVMMVMAILLPTFSIQEQLQNQG